jgi:PAS domain S-box-containing protein
VIFDSVDEGICIIEKVDTDQNERVDFKYILINPAFEKITGLTGVIGKTIVEVVPSVNDSTMQAYESIIKKGQPFRFETYEEELDQWFSVFAFPIDDPELKRVAVIFNDISEIKKSEITLSESAAHKEYMLKLSDAIRSIEDPMLIQLTACRVLGEQIGASRVLYGDVVNEQELVINSVYVNGVPSIAARLNAADYSQFTIDSYLSGKPIIINDVSDPRFSEEEREAFQSIQVAAIISLGLVKDGKWVAAFSAHHKEPRNWTPLEISLMEETAARTWAAVEQAKAEESLIEIKDQLALNAEEKYHLLFNLIDQGFFVIDVIFDENDKPVDMYYLEANNAATKMLGIDFTGKRLRDIDSNYEEYWFEIFGNVAMTGQSLRMEQYAEPDKKWYNFYIFKIGDEKSHRIGNIFLDITESKRAEEALKESEWLYRTLFENTEDGFALVQPIFDESGHSNNYLNLHMNQAWEKQTGLKADDFIGKKIREIMPDIEPSLPEAFANVAKSGESTHLETFNLATNRWYDLYAFNYKEGLVGILFRDISKQKEIKEVLSESEERLRLLTVASANVVYRMSPDWGVMTRLYDKGFIADTEEPNANWLDKYIHPDDHEFVTDVMNECIREKKLLELEHRVLQVDGSIGWTYSRAIPLLDCNGGIKEWFGTASDITERKKVEEALQESEKQLEDDLKAMAQIQILSTSYVQDSELNSFINDILEVAIIIAGAQKGTLQLIKSGAESLEIVAQYGFEQSYINFFSSVSHDTASSCAKAFERKEYVIVEDVTKSPIFVGTPALDIQLAAGVRAVLSIPLINRRGETIGIMSTHWSAPCHPDDRVLRYMDILARLAADIIERKKSEQALKEHQEQLLIVEKEKSKTLEEAIKMKDEFLYLITHEFKTPITVISSAIQSINSSMKTDVSEKLGKYLSMIKMNTNRQLRLVDNLLDITKMNSGNIRFNMDKIDIVYVTKAILNSVEIYALQKGVTLSFTSSISKKEILIDEEKYERIMLNLLSNALKFTPKGKLINVMLSTKKHKNQNFVSISVIDEGIGIPADKQQIIFERFGQADTSMSRQAEGTGLGLHLVKLLVDSLGGEITVKSEAGYGSSFTVMLPAYKQLDLFGETGSKEHNCDILDINSRIIQATKIEFSDIYLTVNTKR